MLFNVVNFVHGSAFKNNSANGGTNCDVLYVIRYVTDLPYGFKAFLTTSTTKPHVEIFFMFILLIN